ncbi:MAG TPA: prepilin-type N-terminal cleavage/methylation domain-containing protein [bacterium]|nr:prepilin-type N-terminal cleavage/methylation domain-containing protein [Candidatus Omnitrophota bacterium]HOJ58948.1 prepilin-type N-terminal cleavage/methylation domain-containing protein [bacterium]HOL95754.1 prepilin-type N-terminal cleavage/methylation domain-containing protein [bacterium]HPP00821.1 prepilin-type N-terminal cleavage/methylation domain-containing protein [bacterium]HXK94723.1 prepilin-type N-terminal cleavage/methylation domain-containing protein [bacterium]
MIPEKKSPAFTLIELLIVVAIIGVLAAIAVPNFLNAQVRAKVARVKGDLKAVANALEMYHLDRNVYPLGPGPDLLSQLTELTTPVAYISTVAMFDPFGGADKFSFGSSFDLQKTYKYFCFKYYPSKPASTWVGRAGLGDLSTEGYLLYSFGPDRAQTALEWYAVGAGHRGMIYHPTNGLISHGDIGIVGGVTPAHRQSEINNAL